MRPTDYTNYGLAQELQRQPNYNPAIVGEVIRRLLAAPYQTTLAAAPQAPAQEAPAAPALDAKAIAEVVCQRVAELPDRNSPEDWPEAMLVTGQELIDAVECEITQALDELAAAPQAPAAPVKAPPRAITVSLMRDGGGEAPAFCLMAAYRSEGDARAALALLAAAPAAPSEGLAADMEAVLTLLEEHEWAEHCTKTPLGQRLEAAITELHNEIHEAEDRAQAAPAAPAVDAETIQRAARYNWMARRVSAHGVCDGWAFGFPSHLTLPAPALAMRDPEAALGQAIDAAIAAQAAAKGGDMTRDELLSFAQQAGIEVHYRKQQARIGIDELTGQDSTGKLERFAALVAAAEREACAKDAEAFHHHGYDFTGNLELHEWLRARPTGHKES